MSDDNRLIGIAWEKRKLLNNWNVVSNKNLLFILSSEILLASLIVIGVFITVISTLFALNKYLRMKLDDLY